MSSTEAGGWGTARRELALALEITALTSVTFARPVLDVMGATEITFVVHQVTGPTMALWALAVVLVPALVFVLIGAASWLAPEELRPRARHVTHCGVVGLLAGLAAWRFGVDQTDLAGSAAPLVLLGLVAGGIVGAVRWWSRSREAVAAFLQYAAVAPVVFMAQFAFASETGEWMRSTRTVDAAAADQVAAQLGDDAPPVVVVVLDELPTAALMDGEGGLDAELYPNLAELADSSTWYLNHTSVASTTERAVPSLVTGSYTTAEDDPRQRPANLFTLLGESHDVQASEAMTDLCPSDYCTRDTVGTVGALLRDSRRVWVDGVRDADPWELLILPGLDQHRYEETADWIDGLDLGRSDRPPLVYLHMLLPHTPWTYLADGTEYAEASPHGMGFLQWSGHGDGIDQARRRLVLQTQATDRLVGQLLDELRAEGFYDDALVVLTSDHGYGFVPDAPVRALSEDNLADLLWVPLFIKEPGQDEGAVKVDNVELVDVLPTIAELVGVDLPWDEVDGFPVDQAADRRGELKTAALGKADPLFEAEDGDLLYRYDGALWFEQVRGADWLGGTGADAIWERTEHAELLRQPVDQLDVVEPVEGVLEVVEPSSWGPFDDDEPRPLMIYGTTELAEGRLEEGQVVAFALNGIVAAAAEVEGTSERPVHGLLVPDLVQDGRNELSAYLVEGDPGSERLRPLDVND